VYILLGIVLIYTPWYSIFNLYRLVDDSVPWNINICDDVQFTGVIPLLLQKVEHFVEMIIRFKVTNFSSGYTRVYTLLAAVQNISNCFISFRPEYYPAKLVAYVVYVYDIFTRAHTHTHTPTYKQIVEAAVAYNVIKRVKSSGNGRWTMGGECTARVLNKNRTTGKENLQQETWNFGVSRP